MKYLLIFSCLFLSVQASTDIKKSWLEKQPRSYAKDFYISLYLEQDIEPSDAIWALGQARKVNNKLLYPYAKALNHKETSRVIQCKRMKIEKLVNEDASCIKLGLRLSKINSISKNDIKTIKNTVKKKYPLLSKKIDIISSDDPFSKLPKDNIYMFFSVFLYTGKNYRQTHFNHHIPLTFLNKLKKSKKQFSSFVKKIVLNPKLDKLQESLLDIDSGDLNHKTQFFLAINAIKHNQNNRAFLYLKNARKSAYLKSDKDKVNYWIYQLNDDKKVLDDLSKSWSNNIYSIYAKEKLNISIDNIVYTNLDYANNKSSYDIKNPFSWLKVLKDSKNMNDEKKLHYEKLFNTKETQGHLAFVNERYFKYQKTFLPNPYEKLINKYSIHRQVLINALAKQESRFIPTSISTSYALGVMQIMPFVSKDIAKQHKLSYNIFEQLEAPTNLLYANHHLDFLEKRLDHVLFIAYAYNGGIGFVKRKILEAGLFKEGKYEPYLSMELVPYDESKKYGKKVLVNYLLYNNAMNKDKKLKLSDLINDIKNDY